jgi:hypothetical protein
MFSDARDRAREQLRHDVHLLGTGRGQFLYPDRHWFERATAAEAAKKAFITNRIGDFGFMLGIPHVWTVPAR